MDFGLARSVESTGLTQTGAMMGTPAYMSPEQAEGKPVDTRSDLFALGIVYYEMLTGVVPFKADTILASLLKRTQGPPPSPIQINAALPPGVSEVVLKCLAVNPAERYQTATELLRDLDALAGGATSTISRPSIPVPVPVPSPAVAALLQNRKWMLAGVAALAIVLGAGSFFAWTRLGNRPPKTVKPVSVLVADFENSTGDSIFNGTLEPMFTLALEGAPFITALR